MNKRLLVYELGQLSKEQFQALRKLKVTPQQEIMGKSFVESIDDWEGTPKEDVLGLGFFVEESPIGLVLFRKQKPAEDGRISVHGLKIALPWQRQGLGHLAFQAAMVRLKSEWPDARLLTLAVDAVNLPAIAIYLGYGMTDSGAVFDGPNGKEHHMEISLCPQTPSTNL